jgi:hypothetical protein
VLTKGPTREVNVSPFGGQGRGIKMAAYKRLQQIGEPETWTICLDPHDIKWSNQSHSMRMFFEKYGHHLPLLIQVTEGFDGIDGFHTFSSGDVSR